MLTVFFDGLCEPRNPGGIACYGWLILGDNGEIVTTGKGVATQGQGATNNVAEYHALLASLEAVRKMAVSERIEVKGDSQLVINQVTGVWQCKAANLRPLWSRARQLAQELGDVEFRWVPRAQNEQADSLSRQAYAEARAGIA